MTLTETLNQIFDLTVDGRINGAHFSRQRLEDYARSLLRTGPQVFIETRLPDGFWYCRIYRAPRGGFDYEYIKDWPF